jgi:hypothetical protein
MKMLTALLEIEGGIFSFYKDGWLMVTNLHYYSYSNPDLHSCNGKNRDTRPFGVSGFQSSRVSGFQSSRVSEFQGSKVSEFQGSRVSEFQGFRVSGLKKVINRTFQ